MATTPFSRRLAALVGTAVAAGTTRTKIARYCRVTPQALSNWCTGSAQPTYENLVRLARLLGTTTDALLGVRPASDFEAAG